MQVFHQGVEMLVIAGGVHLAFVVAAFEISFDVIEHTIRDMVFGKDFFRRLYDDNDDGFSVAAQIWIEWREFLKISKT